MSTEQLANEIIQVPDVKARQGVRQPENTWIDFENGEGIDIGRDIERLIPKDKAFNKQPTAIINVLTC